MSVYRRRYPDGRTSEDWYVSWYVGGRQFKKRIGPNKRTADLYLKDIDLRRVRGELLGVREEKRILFPDLADKYLEWARGRKALHSIEVEESAVTRFKERFSGVASKVTQADVEAFLSERLKTIGPARHNRDLTLLRGIFKKGVEWGYCRTNPALGIKKLKEPPGRIRFLTDEERERLLDACSPRLRALVQVALDSGLRRGELLGLKWENLDLRNRMIRVEHSKNGERRDVPMTDRVLEIFQATPRRLDTPYVYAGTEGRPQRDVKKAWGTAIRRSGVENFTFHDLRHTFASYLVMGGVDIRTVQTLLGHKSITMTMRYAHLSPAHLREAISVLGASGPRTKQDQGVSREVAASANSLK